MDELKKSFLETLECSETVAAALKACDLSWSKLYGFCRTDLNFHMSYENARIQIEQRKSKAANEKHARSLEKYAAMSRYRHDTAFQEIVKARLESLHSE